MKSLIENPSTSERS